MSWRLLIIVLIIGIATLAAFDGGEELEQQQVEQTVEVTNGPMQVWSVYDGKLESRKVVTITSRMRGNATVVDLIKEGSQVDKGSVLARFDATQQERQLFKLEKEFLLARSELESLKNAKLPLELRELSLNLLEAKSGLESEMQYLLDSRKLVKEKLISIQEIDQQERKVTQLQSRVESLEVELELTEKFLHPASLERAEAKLAAAERELSTARDEIAMSVILAPAEGVVVYKSIHVNGDFRRVRIGDSIFPNQAFMVLPDFDDMVVHAFVPEAELSNIRIGNEVAVRPVAFPEMSLKGQVTQVGSMAQSVPGRPSWQRYFHVEIGLDGSDNRIRPGMSVVASVLSYSHLEVLLLDRRAVAWVSNKPYVNIDGMQGRREIKVGIANATHFEIKEGLQAGDSVRVQ